MNPQIANKKFQPGSSRSPRTNATLLAQMARAAEQAEGVAHRLRELRGAVPQPVVAERVGVSLRAYQKWEAGGGIAWEHIQELAKLHGVSEEFLLYGAESDRHPKTQLDRVEQKLDLLIQHFGLTPPNGAAEPPERLGLARQVVDEAPDRRPGEQPTSTSKARRGPRKRDRAS